jgi:hypothetical protein
MLETQLIEELDVWEMGTSHTQMGSLARSMDTEVLNGLGVSMDS